MSEISMLDAAMAYVSRGWPVFPCYTVRDGICSCGNPDCGNPGKHPMIHGGHNNATINHETIAEWWSRWPDANIGFALTPNLAVVDVDIRPGQNKYGDATLTRLEEEYGTLPSTVMSRTGSGGVHYFFTTDRPLRCKTGLFSAIDFKTQGGYVILPPSVHVSGDCYAWMPGKAFYEVEMATLPDWIVASQFEPHERPNRATVLPENNIPEGQRNDTLFKIATSLRAKGLSQEAIFSALLAENSHKCLPPLHESEVAKIAHSAGKYEPGAPDVGAKVEERPTQAEKLLELVYATGATFFHDETKAPYAALPINGHNEVLALGANDFAILLNRLYYKENQKPIGHEAIKQAISVLSASALYDNPEAIRLHTRISAAGGAFWYDLTNPAWQAIRITEDVWTVQDNPPIMFKRYRHQSAQAIPQRGGDVRKILDYMNIRGMDTLFLCWLVSCFVPNIAHPMPIFYGEKGAAKSTASELLKKLLDPSALGTLTLPNDPRTLAVNLQQHWFLPFDNVSHINEETSDTLCRAITGGGIQQRRLYTNDEDMIFTFKRCLAINGINNVATRPDLLDRSILIELERIAEADRRELAEVWAAFEADRPAILGGILDTLVQAMRIFPSLKLEKLPRMADFAKWGYAIGEALGGMGQAFLDQYDANRRDQNTEAINSDPVAQLLVAFMDGKPEWTGLVSALLAELRTLAFEQGISTHNKSFPSQPNGLSRRLRGMKSNLEAMGIAYASEGHSKRGTVVSLKAGKTSSPPSYRHEPNGINASGGDGSVTIISSNDVPSSLSSSGIAIQGTLCDDGDSYDDDFEVSEESLPWD